MHELTINLHMHTVYSDGSGTHAEIAADAIKAGIDAVIISDHNVLVQDIEGYVGDEDKKVLVMVGEEVHDQTREPQKNHLLVFGANREMAALAKDPQVLIDGINEAGGLSFLAHPIDAKAPNFAEQDLSWVNWEVNNYTGIELWNAMTEFKSLLQGYLPAIFYAFSFTRVAHGPFPETLAKWDELLSQGRSVVAVGGSDAHRMTGRLGPISRILFPYEWHFNAVNTHVLVPEKPNGNATKDRDMILNALSSGHAYIGNDLPASTSGFRFTAHCKNGESIMGDTISAKESATLQIKLPEPAECHILKDGEIVRSGKKRDNLIHKVDGAGVYRVEAYRRYKGRRRGWIFSNPIYVR